MTNLKRDVITVTIIPFATPWRTHIVSLMMASVGIAASGAFVFVLIFILNHWQTCSAGGALVAHHPFIGRLHVAWFDHCCQKGDALA
jgi:hypothetical protein